MDKFEYKYLNKKDWDWKRDKDWMKDLILLYEVFLNEENRENPLVCEFFRDNILELFHYLCILYEPSNRISCIRNWKDSFYGNFWFNYEIIKRSSDKEEIKDAEYWIWRKLKLIAYFHLQDFWTGSGDLMHWARKSWLRENILFDAKSKEIIEVIYI